MKELMEDLNFETLKERIQTLFWEYYYKPTYNVCLFSKCKRCEPATGSLGKGACCQNLMTWFRT